jgi:hypothetical protein
LRLDRAEGTDSFVDANQVFTELLETMKFGDLLLCLTKRYGVGEGFGNGLTRHPAGEAQLWIMAGIVRLGAMTGRLATTPDHGGNGTRPQIAQAKELLQQLGPIRF